MRTSRIVAGIGVGAALLGVGMAIGVLLPRAVKVPPPVPNAVNTYLSIAYGASSRTAGSGSGPSPASAQLSAERDCRRKGGQVDCQGLVWWVNGSATFATTAAADPAGWSFGISDGTDLPNWVADSDAEQSCPTCNVSIHLSIGGTIPFNSGKLAPLHRGHTASRIPVGSLGARSNDYWALDFTSKNEQEWVYPIRSGRVVYSGPADGSQAAGGSRAPTHYGDVVVVYHGGGLYSLYAHLAPDGAVRQGVAVTPLDRIGMMSSTGCYPACGSNVLVSLRHVSAGAPITGEQAVYIGDKVGNSSVRLPWRLN